MSAQPKASKQPGGPWRYPQHAQRSARKRPPCDGSLTFLERDHLEIRVPGACSISRAFVSAVSALAFAVAAPAAAGPVDFESEIRPFLERKCLGCHNPNIAKGEVDLSSAGSVLGSAKPLVVAGEALASELYLVATPGEPGAKPYMPEEGEPLSEEEAALLQRWIDAGAVWPEGLVLKEASKAGRDWWAYQPLAGPQLPDIDGYLEERLAEEGLAFNPPAGRRELIRRATYDLTGLPPTPGEVEAFVADEDPRAYERLVDRLLDSPHYGERWGRHWLDVVRFGESRGFERNQLIDDLWPFRDYVIRSINEDKPIDLLIREHLAGDVIGEDDPEVEIGAAFLVAGPYDDVGNQSVEAAAQIRADTLDEIVNATGEAFLGMTLHCARCHDHKFDPISHRDYYQLYATFAGVRHGSRALATAGEKRARNEALAPLESRKAGLEKALRELEGATLARGRERAEALEAEWTRDPVDRTGTEERFAPVTARYVRLVSEANDRSPESPSGFRIDEFEVWSTERGGGGQRRNLALAHEGGKASGAAREIEDFPGAYGPQLAIDGQFGERFFAAGRELTIELAAPAEIERVLFSSARVEGAPEHPQFVFVAEYRIEVSEDGETWREVAHGRDRQPATSAHRDRRLRLAAAGDEERAEEARLRRELAETNREIAAVPTLPQVWLGNPSEMDAEGPFHIFVGGSPQRLGEPVVPASLSTLEGTVPGYELPVDAPEAERRLALAEWIVHPDNPLTPRVLANRIWQRHFGTGIVDTPNDFGYMGGRPSHPELLDFLAGKLIESGWRLKPMHRLVMLSQAYRQSSAWDETAAAIDGDARLLWRFPPRRLSAEEIRDTVLSVSGRLDTGMGGPGFRLYRYMQDNVSTYEPLDVHGPETWRRAVYHHNARASTVDLMSEFDQPDCAFSAPVRAETTTPLQALTMLNHSFTLAMAEALAERVRGSAEGGKGGEGEAAAPEAQARVLLRLAYQRDAGEEEIPVVAAAIREHGLEAACRAVLNSSELIYLD